MAPNSERFKTFIKSISKAPSKPAVLSLIPVYCEQYVPKVLKCDLPKVLTELYDDALVSMENKELQSICDKSMQSLIVSAEQSAHVEAITRDQSTSRTWYRFRSGRVTSSVMRAVCHTNISNPSRSLIMKICYPESTKFSTNATRWGCNHEKMACDLFFERISASHDNVHIRNSGFIISTAQPHVGASPDAIMTCDCCGSSPVEIKCPFCAKDVKLSEVSNKKFFLKEDTDGTLKLDRKHEHYYQVQTQLGVLGMERAFFVVWTEKDLHIEEILFDDKFWTDICLKSKHIFRTAIMPELVGKMYSRPHTDISCTSSYDTELWCYCRDIEHGEMILCENNLCKYQWFHYRCVGVKTEPKGKWYCLDCHKSQ